MNSPALKKQLACDLKIAVEQSSGGTLTLTVFEDGRIASIDLSPEWAAELAKLLTIGSDQGNDRNDRSALDLPAPVLTKEQLNSSNLEVKGRVRAADSTGESRNPRLNEKEAA